MAARNSIEPFSAGLHQIELKRVQWIQEQISPSSQTSLTSHPNRISPAHPALPETVIVAAVVVVDDVVVSPAASRMPVARTLAKASSVASADKDSSASAEAISRTVAIKAEDRGAAGAADAVELPSSVPWITATATQMGTSTE